LLLMLSVDGGIQCSAAGAARATFLARREAWAAIG